MEADSLFTKNAAADPRSRMSIRGDVKSKRHTRPAEPREKIRKQTYDPAGAFYENIVPAATATETHFRHSHWQTRRTRIRHTMTRFGAKPHALNHWDECGSQCQAQWSESRQKFRLAANYCKSRHCEPCMRSKANLIARNLREKLEAERTDRLGRDTIGIRFITLTQLHSSKPLADQVKKINADYKKLRQHEVWKTSQDGGACTIETKWNGKTWHVHLHIVSAGRWINAARLSQAWLECTGDSYIVDVRALNDIKDACHYVAKYITKGINKEVWENENAAQEWIAASRGLRVCNTFGTWRGFKLTKRECGVNDWKDCGSLDQLIERARGGELAAQAIMLNLRPPGVTDAVPGENDKPP